jgi:hypothetical protein
MPQTLSWLARWLHVELLGSHARCPVDRPGASPDGIAFHEPHAACFDFLSPVDDRQSRVRERCGAVSSGISRQITRPGRRRERHSSGTGECARAQRLDQRSQRHRQRGQSTGATVADDHSGDAADSGAVRRLPIVFPDRYLPTGPCPTNGKGEANATCDKQISSLGGESACER